MASDGAGVCGMEGFPGLVAGGVFFCCGLGDAGAGSRGLGCSGAGLGTLGPFVVGAPPVGVCGVAVPGQVPVTWLGAAAEGWAAEPTPVPVGAGPVVGRGPPGCGIGATPGDAEGVVGIGLAACTAPG